MDLQDAPETVRIPSKRKHWSEEEDNALKVILRSHSSSRWTEISQMMQLQFSLYGRTGKQCRERWFNHLCPNISKGPWGVDEQAKLFTLHKRYGNSWAQIAENLPGRSDNSIKNQFYSLIRRQFRKLKETEPSRKQLKKYESTLANQILSGLNKKTKVKQEPQKLVKESIGDLNPIERNHSDHSTILDEQDFILLFDQLDS